MTDPLGLIGSVSPINPAGPGSGASRPGETGGPDFKEFLQQQIQQVNELQNDAKEATEDFLAGRRTDVETVMMATRKADTAFHMLLQVRNKMMEAYEEVKQIRV